MLKYCTTVGVSIRNNVYKFRFSNDNIAKRFKMLKATGNTEIILYALPEPTLHSFAKLQCCKNFVNNVTSPYTTEDFSFETVQQLFPVK